jgi:hypothetical protein
MEEIAASARAKGLSGLKTERRRWSISGRIMARRRGGRTENRKMLEDNELELNVVVGVDLRREERWSD